MFRSSLFFVMWVFRGGGSRYQCTAHIYTDWSVTEGGGGGGGAEDVSSD